MHIFQQGSLLAGFTVSLLSTVILITSSLAGMSVFLRVSEDKMLVLNTRETSPQAGSTSPAAIYDVRPLFQSHEVVRRPTLEGGLISRGVYNVEANKF